ncbi:hypothetical protein D3C76_1713710 [compost metagenome]
MKDFVDVISKNAPAGSEHAVAAFKSTMDSAGSAYENAQKAAKQTADIAKAGFEAASNVAGKAGKTAGGNV